MRVSLDRSRPYLTSDGARDAESMLIEQVTDEIRRVVRAERRAPGAAARRSSPSRSSRSRSSRTGSSSARSRCVERHRAIRARRSAAREELARRAASRSRARGSTRSPSARSRHATTCSASSPTICVIRSTRSASRQTLLRRAAKSQRAQGRRVDSSARSTRMNRLIQDLLDVTRMEAGQLTVDRGPRLARDRLVSTSSRPSGRSPTRRGLACCSSRAGSARGLGRSRPPAPDLREPDRQRDQVHEHRRRITVGAAPRDGEVLFWVQDTGTGISRRASAARVRSLLAGAARERARRRARARHRQGPRRGPRRAHLGREHARARQHLLLHDPDRASGGAAPFRARARVLTGGAETIGARPGGRGRDPRPRYDAGGSGRRSQP